MRKEEQFWFATPVNYTVDWKRVETLKKMRHQEQQRMTEYLHTQECLMAFLARELDDPQPSPCGRCASCLEKPLIPPTFSEKRAREAEQFFKEHNTQIIEPRKQWPDGLGKWKGKNIAPTLRAEQGLIVQDKSWTPFIFV